jgi:hypothetical protein
VPRPARRSSSTRQASKRALLRANFRNIENYLVRNLRKTRYLQRFREHLHVDIVQRYRLVIRRATARFSTSSTRRSVAVDIVLANLLNGDHDADA